MTLNLFLKQKKKDVKVKHWKLVTVKQKHDPDSIHQQSRLQQSLHRLACEMWFRLKRLWGLTMVPAGIIGGTGALEVLVLQPTRSQRKRRPQHHSDWSLSLADLYSSLLKLLYKSAGRSREEGEGGKHMTKGMKWKTKARETPGAKRILMGTGESGKVHVNAGSPSH